MTSAETRYLSTLLISASILLTPAHAQPKHALNDCNTGSYTLNDGSLLDISTAPNGDWRWRWRTLDGRFGPVNSADQTSTHPDEVNLAIEAPTCDAISVAFPGAGEQQGNRLAFEQTERFKT
jgi:hypothetical protein